MAGGRELWNPAAILGAAGAIGLIASSWPKARRAIAPATLLALLLAATSWSATTGDAARGTLAVALIWGTLLTVQSWSLGKTETDRDNTRLPLHLLVLASLCLMSQAGDLLTIFLGLQAVAIGSSVLHSPRDGLALRGRSLSPWLFLLGALLLVAVTGSTRLETIHAALQSSYSKHDSIRLAIAGGGSRVLILATVLIGTALASDAACAPFHFVSRTAVGDTFLMRAAVLVAWIKLWPATITATESTAQLLIGVLAAIAGIVPLLQARSERRLVEQWRLLAIAQGSWLLLAIGAWSFFKRTPLNPAWPVVEWNLPTASQAAWLLLLLDGVAVIGLSGTLAYLRRRERPVEFVDDLRGLIRSEPIAAVCASVCLLSLSGLPLLAGFWSRLFVAFAAMQVRGDWGPPALLIPHAGLLLLTALQALVAVWSASIAMRSVVTILFAMPLGQPRPAGSVTSLFAGVLATVLLIGCGLLPGPLLTSLCAPHVEAAVSQPLQATDDLEESGEPR